MGCDIHAYVERWKPDVGWEWLNGDLFDNMTTYAGATEPTADGEPWEPFPYRHYRLFGFLAGVRDHDVPQIHALRGLPGDLCAELRAEFGLTHSDGCEPTEDGHVKTHCDCADFNPSWYHSHSWATGAELLAFDYGTEMFCAAEAVGGVTVDEGGKRTVGEYLGSWNLERFREIAALADDPRHVRVVYAFDN